MFVSATATRRRWSAGLLELAGVLLGGGLLAVALTYPLAFNLSTLGYKLGNPGDSQYSVWNVAWVSHALLTEPWRVFDANIFYPHLGTLFYSEANLAAGVLGVPAMWLTGNAYAAHNSAVLLSFVLSAAGAYYLVRYITRDRRAATIAGISFGFCPYAFSHLPHIQLLMTAGIPFGLLAFHRLADRPTIARGVVLGATMAGQALACAYYAVFVVMLVAAGVVFNAIVRGAWRDRRFLVAVATAAIVFATFVLPLYLPYEGLRSETGFSRPLQEAVRYSATWSSYLTSAAYLSSWMYPLLPGWSDVLFPGYVTLVFGLGGAVVLWRRGPRDRTMLSLYGGLATFALWESFGPRAGLYALSYRLVPAFSFLRAPSRFGIVVTLALSVLAGIVIARLLAAVARPSLVAAIILSLTILGRVTWIPLTPNPEFHPVYEFLAAQPDGALLELPLYSRQANFYRTQYMLASTVHWKPLVNAYSDVIPLDFAENREVLSRFPTFEAFRVLQATLVRYVTFHLNEYDELGLRSELESDLAAFAPYLRELYGDDVVRLYEVVDYPSSSALASTP